MGNNTRGAHSGPNWGSIVTVVIALIAGTWALSEKFSGVDDRVDGVVKALEDSIRAVRSSVAKLEVPEAKSESESITEVALDEPRPGVLEELCRGDTSAEDLIRVGETVTGTLSRSDERMEDETYFDAWMLPVCVGGPTTIEMTSETLDAYLILSSLSDLSHIADDDDGGIGLNARLTVDLEAGLYLIAANTASSLIGELTGSYMLSVQR
ncbi:MAG: hypothetical protein F4106_07985 [Gemmatimonadetes bacterium]|nr:hypothetical protein [Gemmatimonadota bacterium]MYC91454.1 hypothetical protein [Gemmatimonadota bacterium]MYJ17968.1 hypothetical protein [Gemmatimonadota bacterium]